MTLRLTFTIGQACTQKLPKTWRKCLMLLVGLPLLVCECWIESHGSWLSPCPSGQYLPTSPCSLDPTGCMFLTCSSRDLYPPVEMTKPNVSCVFTCCLNIKTVKKHSAIKHSLKERVDIVVLLCKLSQWSLCSFCTVHAENITTYLKRHHCSSKLPWAQIKFLVI